MLAMLIAVGRFSVAAAAVVTIAATTIAGWVYGIGTSNQVPGAIGGFFAGLLLAGSIFGIAAAIFDMQRSLRTLARNPDSSVFSDDDWERRRLNEITARRAEPRI
jgi:hypothetical protein